MDSGLVHPIGIHIFTNHYQYQQVVTPAESDQPFNDIHGGGGPLTLEALTDHQDQALSVSIGVPGGGLIPWKEGNSSYLDLSFSHGLTSTSTLNPLNDTLELPSHTTIGRGGMGPMSDWLGLVIVLGVAILVFLLKFIVIKCYLSRRRGLTWADVENVPRRRNETFFIDPTFVRRHSHPSPGVSGRRKGPPPKFEKALKCSTPVRYAEEPPPSYEEYLESESRRESTISTTTMITEDETPATHGSRSGPGGAPPGPPAVNAQTQTPIQCYFTPRFDTSVPPNEPIPTGEGGSKSGSRSYPSTSTSSSLPASSVLRWETRID